MRKPSGLFAGRRSLALPAIVVLVACTSNNPSTTTAPDADASIASSSSLDPKGTPLFSIANEPPGAHCPNGGEAILFGYDSNKNGRLDPPEVTSVTYVCNGITGKPGQSALVRQSIEPAGAHCTNGGTKIDSGLDTNGDGTLEDGEVTGTTYVCNGATGPAASPPLVALTAEPAGASCASGGERIDVGIDANHDGILQPGEIASTGYVCNGAAGTSPTLTTTTTLPPGPTCTYGGDSVQAGIDASGDGVLQANEILFVTTICTLRTSTPIAPGATCANGGTHYDYGRDRNQDGVLEASEIETTEDVCLSCGNLGLPCCTSGTACTGAGVMCDTGSNICAPCGALGAPCCGTDQTCRCAGTWTQCGGLGGIYTTCATCGGPGEPCCRPYPPHSACGVTGNCKVSLTCTAFGTCQP